jgi:predicted AAA+ superfamily ATPase
MSVEKLPDRQIDAYLWDEELIARKMVFLSGPRQVGKTTYAQRLLASRQGAYYNWDNPSVRRRYREDPLFFLGEISGPRESLIVFDEIHKRPKWKDILKGLYDSIDHDAVRLLVTGSARLEWFRRSGDSLVGRYAHFHMLPISLSELAGAPLKDAWLTLSADWKRPWASLQERLDHPVSLHAKESYEQLYRFGGFPEPLSRGSERFARKWREDYLSLILREDLRDLSQIKATDTVENMVSLLPERVGSPLSIQSLAEDLESSHPTIKNYLTQLERLWLLFSIKPWSRRLNRTLRKERKTYFLNWTSVPEESKRFENFIAASLLKAAQVGTDLAHGRAELWYIRTFDKREIDFLLTLDDRPALLVEAKLSETDIGPSARRVAAQMGIPFVQVVQRQGIFSKQDNSIIISANRFLAALP